MSYNGWTNYETWAAALWIDNEQSSYEYAREIVRGEPDDYRAAENLKAWMEDDTPDLGCTLWGDLLTAAFSEVNWREIVERYREDEDE